MISDTRIRPLFIITLFLILLTGCPDLNIALYDESCALLESSELPGCQEEEILITWDGTCGFDDSFTFIVRVFGADDSQVSEEEYILSIDLTEL
jgi:hypothetical protein